MSRRTTQERFNSRLARRAAVSERLIESYRDQYLVGEVDKDTFVRLLGSVVYTTISIDLLTQYVAEGWLTEDDVKIIIRDTLGVVVSET